MHPVFLVFAVCAFASGFALRTIDPLVIPIAHHFAVTPAAAALLSTAYALPYAIAQPFLGPLGDRFGKARCIQVCIALLALALLLGAIAPTFESLMVTRVAASPATQTWMQRVLPKRSPIGPRNGCASAYGSA